MGLQAGDYLGIVCPMANEGAEAVRFVVEVLRQVPRTPRVTFFAILDRATKDNSVELLRSYAQQEPRLEVVWAPENRGVVDAYVRGYREALAAGCSWILEIDAGFSHRPDEVPRFLEQCNQGYDCIFGSRFMPGGAITDKSVKRYLISRGGTWLANGVLGTRQTDMTSGFELFSRRALTMVLARGIQSRAHFFQTEIKFYCRHLRYIEIPIHYRSPSPRLGSSAMKDAFRQLWRLFRERLRSRGTKEDLRVYEDQPGGNLHCVAKSDSH